MTFYSSSVQKKIGMSKVTQAARQLRLPEEKLLGDWIVCIPGFTLDKYRRLQRSRLSIFSMNCFGGIISDSLGLPFYSPYKNLTLGHIVRRLDWIKVIYYDVFDMLLYGKKTPLIEM